MRGMKNEAESEEFCSRGTKDEIRWATVMEVN